MNRLGKYLVIGGALLASIIGCSRENNTSRVYYNVPEAKNYDIKIDEGSPTLVRIGNYTKRGFDDGVLIGEDQGNDGRIDKVKLVLVPKGSDLEKLASVEKVSEILQKYSK